MTKIGLIGNPNVGKSTIFNELTGLHQHTGNWSGKTVGVAKGSFVYKNKKYLIEDLPGTYSLTAKSAEEEVTRDYVYFEDYELLVVVCDAVCLERNLNILLQVLEVTNKVILCVNMMDEAIKKKIKIDLESLEKILNIKVVGTNFKDKKSINNLKDVIENFKEKETFKMTYDDIILNSINIIKKDFPDFSKKIYYDLLTSDYNLIEKLSENYNYNALINSISKAQDYLYNYGIKKEEIPYLVISEITRKAEEIASKTVRFDNEDYDKKDRTIDKVLTNKITSIPIMILGLLIIFWITISGANIFSDLLYNFLFSLEKPLLNIFNFLSLPNTVIDCLVYGVYRVLAWVVSVMLPPMAIFFPLFALLEDFGILPRIAFNLDKYFKKCASCGKQALTMCMGIGCNAVGVVGARIIDSKRERLLAILTNSLVPCNGRFPALIAIITMFLAFSSFSSSIILTLVIVFSIFMTFFISKILSKTLLKGSASSFTLELPPYRKPKIIKVIVRSLLDKALFVLLRAICVAAPAGFVIWILANIDINNISLLSYCSDFLDPLGKFMGLDGTILMAFILGFPANEIVVPLMIMGYMALGNLTDISNLDVLKNILITNGWTITTAICFMIFSLMHFPCLTTVLTIKKEAGLKWSIYSILIPLMFGIITCFVVKNALNLIL